MKNNQRTVREPNGGTIIHLVSICGAYTFPCWHSEEAGDLFTGDVRE
jgi:hypothetical protein